MKGKRNQEYTEEMAPIVPAIFGKRAGNHLFLIKCLWKYAKENELVGSGARPFIKADKLLKKLFGKDEIYPLQDAGILKKNGHVKSIVKSAA